MRIMALSLGLGLLAASCAARGASPLDAPRSLSVDRGRAVAELRCAGCHAIDEAAPSRRVAAPRFRELGLRFNTISWERAMAEIGKGGHEEMPPLQLDSSDIRDLRAYVESLR